MLFFVSSNLFFFRGCWYLKLHPATVSAARRFCTILATSVQPERLFSATGRVISKLRSQLLPEHAEMLVFLNKNSGLFE